MKRYLLVLIPVIACVVFIAVITVNSVHSHTTGATNTGNSGQLIVTPTVVPVVTRHEAIGWAVAESRTMGEDNPVLVDVSLGNYLDEVRKLYPNGMAIEGSSAAPHNRLVWLVRMRGAFVPPHQLPGSNFTPEPGVMHIVIDALTGQKIADGYIPDNP